MIRRGATSSNELDERATLVDEIADLLVLGRHFGAGAAVEDRDLAVAETACGAGAVHRHIAAADDADVLTDTRGRA